MHIEIGDDDTFTAQYRWLQGPGSFLAVTALRETLPPDLDLRIYHCNLVSPGVPEDPPAWAAFCAHELHDGLERARQIEPLREGGEPLSLDRMHLVEPVVVTEEKARVIWTRASHLLVEGFERPALVWPRDRVLVAIGGAVRVPLDITLPAQQSAPQDV